MKILKVIKKMKIFLKKKVFQNFYENNRNNKIKK